MRNLFLLANEIQSFCRDRGWRFCFIGGITLQRWAVLPGVLPTPKGVRLSASPTGQTATALLDADIRIDIKDGACCDEAFCDVARVAQRRVVRGSGR